MDLDKFVICLMAACFQTGLSVNLSAADMPAVASNRGLGTSSSGSSVTVPNTTLSLSNETADLEDGKALYENGQFIAALGKFMTVLRKDPHQPEARQYLRLVVDIMRQNPTIAASKIGTSGGQAVVASALVQEEVRKMLKQRGLFSMDLKAIPGVQFTAENNMNQVSIETPLLFEENSGGLKEQGIPILDRVAAWLKTYGQQPVIIHCYPEELLDPTKNGSLFLQRYSQLFSFFVEEKRLPPQRFVSADLLSQPAPANGASEVLLSTMNARIVIETIGSQSAALDATPSAARNRALSRWLELSILTTRPTFNPEEGEWATLDIAALTRTGLREWSFEIMAAEGPETHSVMKIDGKGNLLKRISWDGHHQKTGSIVQAGHYVAKLAATDGDGTIMRREAPLQVLLTTPRAAVLVQKPRPKKARKPAAKKRKMIEPASVPAVTVAAPTPKPPVPAVAPTPTPAPDDSDSLIDSKPAAAPVSSPVPAPEPPMAEDNGDSVHSIWKQVIQFEPGQSELKPTVKASLERIGKTLEVYPLQKVRITGFAMASEPNADQLARQRAEVVRSILVEEYHVDKKRVIVAGGKTTHEDNASKVEMSITN